MLWDDKLAPPSAKPETSVPPNQCLYFPHHEFDEFIAGLHDVDRAPTCLKIEHIGDKLYQFSAADPDRQPYPKVRLLFTEEELHAFLLGAQRGEFDRVAFTT
ncbi:hypothetical protein [Nocardia sp. NPDC003963]